MAMVTAPLVIARVRYQLYPRVSIQPMKSRMPRVLATCGQVTLSVGGVERVEPEWPGAGERVATVILLRGDGN
ncbi:hypothetical protein AQJ30_23895 [Streptomyces longwoodensis]|uniref:Uncharacterized protein n=1 Tax=Streptomyces longwoodensis TaxID=68231 RepID=A0A101QTI2_9ACTN|nr:hypothetical protein AQJ30_23895 [Streptomyces longwoodensis]